MRPLQRVLSLSDYHRPQRPFSTGFEEVLMSVFVLQSSSSG
jgi:hypothetical protein